MPDGTTSSGFKSPSLWLSLLSMIATTLAIYVGLRLEPLYQRIARIEESASFYQSNAQGYVNDYIAFKAQTMEIMRQQNAEIADIKAETRRIRSRP